MTAQCLQLLLAFTLLLLVLVAGPVRSRVPGTGYQNRICTWLSSFLVFYQQVGTY
jgi:hypothetical protein